MAFWLTIWLEQKREREQLRKQIEIYRRRSDAALTYLRHLGPTDEQDPLEVRRTVERLLEGPDTMEG